MESTVCAIQENSKIGFLGRGGTNGKSNYDFVIVYINLPIRSFDRLLYRKIERPKLRKVK